MRLEYWGHQTEAYTRECVGCGEKGSKAEMIKDPECGLYYHPECLWEWLLDSYPIIGQKIEQLRQIERPK